MTRKDGGNSVYQSWNTITYTSYEISTGMTVDLANGKAIATKAGWYEVNGQVALNNTTPAFAICIRKNGSDIASHNMGSNTFGVPVCSVSTKVFLNVGDYITMNPYSSNSLSTSASYGGCYLDVMFLHD